VQPSPDRHSPRRLRPNLNFSENGKNVSRTSLIDLTSKIAGQRRFLNQHNEHLMSKTIYLTDEQSKQFQDFFYMAQKSAEAVKAQETVAVANDHEIDDETWKRLSFHDKLVRYRDEMTCNPERQPNLTLISNVRMMLQQVGNFDLLVEPHADVLNVLGNVRAQLRCLIDWQEPDAALHQLMPGWRYAETMRSKDHKPAEMYEAIIIAREMGGRTGLCAATIDADLNIEKVTLAR
jgi:hypothetical protein